MEQTTPRWKRTNFWFGLVTVISTVLFLLGIVGENAKDDTIDVGNHVIEAVGMVLGLGGMACKHAYNKYKSRNKLKTPTKRRRRRKNTKSTTDECDEQ